MALVALMSGVRRRTSGSPVIPVVTTVTVSPSSATIAPDGTQPFTATAYDQNGNVMPDQTFTWTSSDEDVATVDSDGLASGVAGGSATITATCETVPGTADLTVSGPPLTNLVTQLTATAGTSTTTDGASVASWTDQSETGTVYAQATAANQPTYHTNVLNGLPVLRFDGTNDVLVAPGVVSALNSSAVSVFLVCKKNGGTADICPAIANTDGTQGGFLLMLGTNSTNMNLDYGTGSAITFLTDPSGVGTGWNLFTGICNPAASSTKEILRRNGSQVATANNPYVAQSTMAPNVGGLTFASAYFNGDIAEILIYDVALDSDQIAAVESYLTTKWGL